MNENLSKSLRLSMIFGFAGALGIPLCYEIYANLSQGIALFFLITASVLAGIRLSQVRLRDAFIGFVFMFALTAGFAIVGFMIIHPKMVEFLNSHSRYFELSFSQSVKYFVKAAGIQIIVPLVCVGKVLWKFFVKKLRENSEATKAYIDNAFDDSDEKNIPSEK